MTLDEMKTLLAGRLGQRTDIDQMIYNEIREAQRTLEKTPPYPWFLAYAQRIEYDKGITPLVPDFIETFDDWLLLRKRTDETVYWATPVKVYGGQMEHIIDPRPGRPRNFHIYGDNIVLYPNPDVSYTFELYYYRKIDPLVSPSSENLWSIQANDLLISEAGWHVARNIRDNEAATLFGQDRAEARRRVAQETTSRLESRRRAVIGSGEDAMLNQMTWEAGHQ